MPTGQPYPVVSHLLDRFGSWLKQRRELDELSQLNGGEIRRMASELGLAPSDLDALVRRGIAGTAELPQMLRALRFDDKAIARIAPPQMAQMRHACAECAHKRTCGADLAAHTAAKNFETYCVNANDIALLQRGQRAAQCFILRTCVKRGKTASVSLIG
jgi:hypothetical protein